jgi:hypothetical protein
MHTAKKQLLMVCPTAFLEGWLGPTPRFFQVAEGLREYGWNTTMLAASLPDGAKPNDAELAFPGQVIRTPFPNGPHPNFLDRKGLRMLFRLSCLGLGYRKLYEDPDEGWARRLRQSGFVAKFVPSPDIVWAVSYGGVANLCAGKEVARQHQCPWVMEFHDPCPEPGKQLNLYEEKALQRCYAECGGVIAVSQFNADKIISENHGVACKTHVVHLSYDQQTEKFQKNANDNGKFILLHAGALYGGNGRNGRNIVHALKLCFDKDPGLRDKLLFRIVGGWQGAAEVSQLAKELNIQQAVETIDPVPSKTALIMMSQADVLVIIKFADPLFNGQIPGKLFQYMGQRKPIIGIMGECEAADLLRRSGLGIIHSNEDVEGIAKTINRFYENRYSPSFLFQPNENFIQQFSKQSTSFRINSILSSCL